MYKLAGTNQVSIIYTYQLTHPPRLVRPLYWHAPSSVNVCAHASTPIIIIIHIRQSSHLEIVGGATVVCSRTCARACIRG